MMVVDASVWISTILVGDANHRPSIAWLAMFNQAGLTAAVPAHFPAEVSGATHRIDPAGRSLQRTIASLFGTDFFAIHPIDLDLAHSAAEIAGRSAMRGSDAVYVALASRLDLPLLTWDQEQGERGRLFCRTMTPLEMMELN
jgi:predicted nucleic acid-binding protein